MNINCPHFVAISEALIAKRELRFIYLPDTGRTGRVVTVRPMCVTFRGDHWSLVAWCDRRKEWRTYRADRILSVESDAKREPDAIEAWREALRGALLRNGLYLPEGDIYLTIEVAQRLAEQVRAPGEDVGGDW